MNPVCWSAVWRRTCAVVAAGLVCATMARAADIPKAEAVPPAGGVFAAATRHLQPGGVVYGCVDFTGDAAALRRLLANSRDPAWDTSPWNAVLQFRLEPLVDLLGISDIAAVGVSSVARDEGLFENRTFFHMPQGRHGLLEALGGEPGPFRTTSLAPSDVDFFYEAEFDLARAYRVIRSGAAEMMGAGAGESLDELLSGTFAPVGETTLLDLVAHAQGRFTVVAVLEPERTAFVDLDVPIKVPAFSLLVRVEGIGRRLTPLLDQIPIMELSIREGRRHYSIVGRPLVSTWTPAVVIDGDVAYIGSSQAFILACLGRREGLERDPAFTAAIAEQGGVGNAITWISPRMLTLRKRVVAMNEGSRSTHIKDLKSWLPGEAGHTVAAPLISVRVNLPDGILYRSRWDASLKQELFSATFLNPVTLAMSAGILEPHYRHARARSEEVAIYNNLRRLQVYSRQYCYDHRLTTVPIRKVMGSEPGKLVPPLDSIAGEDYGELIFVENYPLRVTTADGRVIEYGP